ncbi:hypothetical protein F0562_003734 [Nyssa sinensis]|uniref:Salicylate carboxymethyltransferase n=1 Tax=Nyssa sinensis TaxID=561372 RepID=A0A5J5C0H1_9ASTE|nr:hypothetical protein F0562_003734 [Nyssa sinensis]
MEVVEVLHMNGGIGETSYANNSLVQLKVISMTKPITEQAIADLYRSTLPRSLCIADLGCSSGPNTLLVVSELIKAVERIRKKLGHQSLEFHVCLNDLPGNDFNTIFKSLSSFQEKMKKQLGSSFGPCFVTGVPGSFYGRLFPTNSLHFIHSSYSLQWLSKVPEGVENNKGNIYMASTSPPSVLKAYYEQFQRDFSVFLKCRSEELVGIIEEEKMDSFNIPQYTPSPMEVKSEVQNEGSFAIDRLEATEVNWNAYDNEFCPSEAFKDGGYNVAKCMRAVAEPLLVSHFGEIIIDEVFSRYREIVANRMSKEKTQFINVVVSLTKNG